MPTQMLKFTCRRYFVKKN